MNWHFVRDIGAEASTARRLQTAATAGWLQGRLRRRLDANRRRRPRASNHRRRLPASDRLLHRQARS